MAVAAEPKHDLPHLGEETMSCRKLAQAVATVACLLVVPAAGAEVSHEREITVTPYLMAAGMSGCSRSTSSRRRIAPAPRWNVLMIQPRAMVGQTSNPR